MNLFLIFCGVMSIVVSKQTEKKCDGIRVQGKCHKLEVLTFGIDRPYQLSYSNKTDRLYFSYNMGLENSSEFEIGFINIQIRLQVATPVNVTNGFATAVDHENHVVYFGGSEGIYKEDHRENKGVETVHSGVDVWDLFYRHHLYYISYPSMRLHKLDKEPKLQKHIHEQIYQFAIDKDEDTFITNKTGLFMIKNGTDHRILIKGAKIFRAIEISHHGKAYFCGQNHLYVVDKHHHVLEKIADIDNIFGLTFDGQNNIIYSDPLNLVKLTLSDEK